MGVRIVGSSYMNPFANVSEATTGYPNWLIGNVGDWVTARFTVEAGVDFKASMQSQVEFEYSDKTIKLLNGKKWGDYGFDIGNTVTVKVTQYTKSDPASSTWTPSNITQTITITNVVGSMMYYSGGNSLSQMNEEIVPFERSMQKVTVVLFTADISFEGLRMKYSLIPNSDVQSNSLLSLIDGTETELFAKGIQNSTTVYTNMIPIGMQSGMAIESGKVKMNTGYDLITGPIVTLPQFGSTISLSGGVNKLSFTPAFFVGDIISEASIKPPTALTVNDCFIKNTDTTGKVIVANSIKFVIEDKGSEVNKRLALIYRVLGSENNIISETVVNVVEINRDTPTELFYTQETEIDMVAGQSLHFGFDLGSTANTNITPTSLKFIIGGSNQYSNVVPLPVSYKKRYDIVLNYMITPFWDQMSDIEDRRIPPFLSNSESLTDNKNIKFYPKWNNPNTIVENDMTETQRLGNTGWFDENYNGLPNNFTVKSVRYLNSVGAQISDVDYVNETTVEVIVSGIKNLVNINTVVSFGFAWIPIDDDDYKNLTTPFHENARISSPLNSVFNLGSTQSSLRQGFSPDGISRMDSKNIQVSQIGNDVMIRFTLVPTPAFSQLIEDNNKDYMIWVSVEDSVPVTNISDRVTLLADSGLMVYNLIVDGELDGALIGFLEHPYTSEIDQVDIYDGYIEDDLVSVVNFGLDVNNEFLGMRFGFEAEKNNVVVDLDNSSINFSSFPFVNGATEVNYDALRGFYMGTDGYRNSVRVMRNNADDTASKRMYKAFFGNKLRWEDWIQKQNVPSVFFDNTLPFNGFNNNWFQYQFSGGKVYFYVIFEYTENGIIYRKKNRKEVKLHDFDDNDIIETRFKYIDYANGNDITIGTDPQTGDPLGTILNVGYTKVEVYFKSLIPTNVFDVNFTYATATLEGRDGAGYMQNRMISTVASSEADNPMEPMPGNTLMQLTQISNVEVMIEFLINPTKLENIENYIITARIGCNGNPNFMGRIYDENDYEIKYE